MKNLLLTFILLIAVVAASAQTARVQVIHNSADAIADSVDIYLDDVLLLDNFAFRNATPFIDAPADDEIVISVAPKTSTSVDDTIVGFPVTLSAGATYVVVADGIVSASGYSPATPFSLEIYDMGREEASMVGNTDVLVHHGSTDAPAVDVVETLVGAGTIVDDAAYSNFAGYLELGTLDYRLDIRTADGITTVATFEAPLATLLLDDAALVVVASGFLDPSMNSGGPAFGLYVALASGGEMIALPVVDPTGIEEQVETSWLSVYPNPARDFLTLNMDNSKLPAQVEILSVDGRVAQTIGVNQSTQDLALEGLTPGMYFVRVLSLNDQTQQIQRLQIGR